MGTTLGFIEKQALINKPAHPVDASECVGHEWAIGGTNASLECGQRHHALYVVDISTHNCLAIDAGLSLSAEGIINVLDQLKLERGLPTCIHVDKSSGSFSNGLQNWCDEHNVKLGYINNIKPSQGARIERFHHSFEAEFLSASSFLTLEQFRELASIWRMNYNKWASFD